MNKKLLVICFCIILCAFWITPLILSRPVYSQASIAVECGEIIEKEFIQNNETQGYLLTMAARESFEVSVEPAGDNLKTIIQIFGPTNVLIADTGWRSWQKMPSASSGILSAKGTYRIEVSNGATGIGLYSLLIGCTTKNGIVKPGDKPVPTLIPAPLPSPTVRPAIPLTTTDAFSGVGFPGLAPVDFSDIALIPLDLDIATNGVVPLDNQILGFTIDAEANDVLDLRYQRKAGNLNLGIVVLSATNKVVFQASLVTSESLMSRFILPEAGQYTIGVFRISLIEPDQPKATAFQLLAKLNAKQG